VGASRTATLLVVACLVLAACTNGDGRRTAPRGEGRARGATARLTCETALPAQTHPNPQWSVTAGPVTFIGGKGTSSGLDEGPVGEERPGRYHRIKLLVLVDYGATVKVVVPERERNRFALLYGRPARDDTESARDGPAQISDGWGAVRFDACHGPTPRQPSNPDLTHSEFAGAVVARRPGCFSLDVYTHRDAEPARVELAFGVPSCA
jgi:hypothetical protein